MAAFGEAAAVASALLVYRTRVVPQVRRGLVAWRRLAASIPDSELRRQALAAIDEKALNVEATAVFAILAPRRRRADAIRAMVALQVAIDYLDNLGERAAGEPLRAGLQLHRAIAVAVSPGADGDDWYRFHARHDDGGYLAQLVRACQESVRALPSWRAIEPHARDAAIRCGEGQSYTHAAELGDVVALETWAERLEAPAVYRWWEKAAAASSSVAVHALIAAAADRHTTAAGAEPIDAAYFPPIGALTVLLDDLVDRDEDAASGAHNYLAYYRDGEDAANRLELIARLGASAVAGLRHRRRHTAILAGVVGFYLSAPVAAEPDARPIRERLLRAVPAARPIVTFMRLRRWA